MKLLYFFPVFMMAFTYDTGIIGETGFEEWQPGHVYTKNSLEKDGFSPAYVQGFDQERCVVDDKHARSGKKSLKVMYPKGGVGPAETGASAPLRFDGKDEAYISYWIRFSKNFDWGRQNQGGKLPGLGSGENCSGGETCDGTNGFTARMMWREGGSAVMYLYHMDKPGKYGEDIPLRYEKGGQVVFEKGKWYKISERVRINSGNERNGEVEVWVNNKPVLEKKGIQFVNDGSEIDNFYISSFHGGADKSWSPREDCYIWYDDWVISTKRDDVVED